MTTLHGMTWDHPRGIDALLAVGREYTANTGVEIDWVARPLHEFEETPLARLATRFDLLAMDHPFIGDAVEADALIPLDGVWSRADLDDRAGDSAGRSVASYSWNGRQWAGAVDAACMVSAYRTGAIDSAAIPREWEQLAEFSAEHGRRAVLLAANPTHLWGTVLSMCHGLSGSGALPDGASTGTSTGSDDGRPGWWGDDGIEPDLLADAISCVIDVVALCAPESMAADPIAVLDRLSAADGAEPTVLYSPLVFGYITYSVDGAKPTLVSFADAPGFGSGPVGTLTGGVGLAVSAHSPHREAAADFVRFATDREVQLGSYSAAGGQAGRRSVWANDELDHRVNGFYGNTLATMDRSFLRPRLIGYPEFQRLASLDLHSAVTEARPVGETVRRLADIWKLYVRP